MLKEFREFAMKGNVVDLAVGVIIGAAFGAIVTSLLLTIGKSLIGLYIGSSRVASSYGAAGALIIILLWIYYSAEIFLLGAEFTKCYAHSHGSRAKNADATLRGDRDRQRGAEPVRARHSC